LEELHHQKAQVLDLELLANHKGSVLGGNIYSSQPSQKLFETNILKTLQQFNTNQVVFIEAESRKIGSLQVPDSLLEKIRESPCIRIAASLQARVVFLLRDYDYMTQNPGILIEKLSHLKEIHGQNILNNWSNLINLGHWEQLIEELLVKHYDHLYKQSQIKNFSHFENAQTIQAEDLSHESIAQIAHEINRNYACSVARPSTQGLI
jgi:tRNA 2-selenouridine synthase